MSALTPPARQLAHAVMGVDWHGWLFLLGVLAACWVVTVVVTATLFAGGSARPSQGDPVRTALDNAAAKSPASRTRNRRHV